MRLMTSGGFFSALREPMSCGEGIGKNSSCSGAFVGWMHVMIQINISQSSQPARTLGVMELRADRAASSAGLAAGQGECNIGEHANTAQQRLCCLL